MTDETIKLGASTRAPDGLAAAVVAELRKVTKFDHDTWPHGMIWTIGGVQFVEWQDAQEAIRKASSPASVAPPNAVVSKEEYTRNMLDSMRNWLVTRSNTAWAKDFGYSSLMQGYGEFLSEFIKEREK